MYPIQLVGRALKIRKNGEGFNDPKHPKESGKTFYYMGKCEMNITLSC